MNLSELIKPTKEVFSNVGHTFLVEHALKRNEALLSSKGALVVKTGSITGRSPQHKFIVQEPSTEADIWWGNNRGVSEEIFDKLKQKVLTYLNNIDFYTQDLRVGADPANSLRVRVINEFAWHSLFARNMFIQLTTEELVNFAPEFTVINVPNFRADPKVDGTAGETFIFLNFKQRLVLIGGTRYAGETKKAVFSYLNYVMPKRGILSMHCSANIGAGGDSALFFGLSGTGKTTLSADPARSLIGDDEHCWSNNGIFNIEGGCYAKCINLDPQAEPLIYDAIRYGTVVENVVIDRATREIDYEDAAFTENTRAAYPLHHIPNAVLPSVGPHPKNILFLTCDAYGVLPPISRLSPAQAMYHFLLGYTAKVAGTETGITEPTLTFSPCFGAPFLPMHPTVYARLLGEKIAKHQVRCWLVNTGWSGGPYGVGSRMKIAHTRALVNAALSGELNGVAYRIDPVFGFEVPTSCPGVPAEVLNPRNTWADKAAYDAKADQLATEFEKNFQKYAEFATPEVRNAGPRRGIA